MSFLIDTNIISELRKKARCDPNVTAWYESVDEGDLYLSVLVVGEIRRGVELARRRAPPKAAALEGWLSDIDAAFADRMLSVDRAVTDDWRRTGARR